MCFNGFFFFSFLMLYKKLHHKKRRAPVIDAFTFFVSRDISANIIFFFFDNMIELSSFYTSWLLIVHGTSCDGLGYWSIFVLGGEFCINNAVAVEEFDSIVEVVVVFNKR